MNILKEDPSDFRPLAYFRDRLVPAVEAKLSVYDLGIVLGATVTDMARTHQHEPFRLKDHVVWSCARNPHQWPRHRRRQAGAVVQENRLGLERAGWFDILEQNCPSAS